MSLTVKLGATLTGGSDVILSSAGVSPGKSTFVTPDHTVLTPQTITFSSIAPQVRSGAEPGTARTSLQITMASRSTGEEGCCTVTAGNITLDLGVRWNLNQPEAQVDKVIAMVKAVVYTTAFSDAIKKAILPT